MWKFYRIKFHHLDIEVLKRRVLSFYDTKRLTQGINERLDLVAKMAREEDDCGTAQKDQ